MGGGGGATSGVKISAIYTSDLSRARETATIIAGVLGFPADAVVNDVRLRETNLGGCAFGGLAVFEALRQAPLARRCSQHVRVAERGIVSFAHDEPFGASSLQAFGKA